MGSEFLANNPQNDAFGLVRAFNIVSNSGFNAPSCLSANPLSSCSIYSVYNVGSPFSLHVVLTLASNVSSHAWRLWVFSIESGEDDSVGLCLFAHRNLEEWDDSATSCDSSSISLGSLGFGYLNLTSRNASDSDYFGRKTQRILSFTTLFLFELNIILLSCRNLGTQFAKISTHRA